MWLGLILQICGNKKRLLIGTVYTNVIAMQALLLALKGCSPNGQSEICTRLLGGRKKKKRKETEEKQV